jgi:hypothetical protein
MPAEFRKAAVLSASTTALTEALRSLAMSIPLAHADAWMARITLVAYRSRSLRSA